VIETERLVLRPLQADDLDAFTSLNADPEVAEWIGGVKTREETATWLNWRMEAYTRQGYGHLAVLDRKTRSVLGRCGLAHWEIEGDSELEIGYALVRSAWGRGFATEAGRAVRDYAVTALGQTRLIALVAYGNERSARVAERLGMTHERDAEFHGKTHRLYSLNR
jgi:ribosomal-protein-alanine N-acetyltransferase